MKISLTNDYKWNDNFSNPIAHKDIKLIIEELESIQDTRGAIKPEYIIESSKNKKSILHSYFQWDDEKAAHSWRMQQATNLLNRIEVKIVKDGQPRIVKAFELTKRNSRDNDFEYKKYVATNENVEFAELIVIGDLKRAINRLSAYEGFERVIELIQKAIEELSKESTETKEEVKPTELKSAV